jgi:hypothetical protein
MHGQIRHYTLRWDHDKVNASAFGKVRSFGPGTEVIVQIMRASTHFSATVPLTRLTFKFKNGTIVEPQDADRATLN